MKIATISQTKNHLSALLDRVRHGETVLIVDRHRPIARLEPVATVRKSDSEGRLARLERAGLLRRGDRSLVDKILRQRPPKARPGADIVEILLAERAEGR